MMSWADSVGSETNWFSLALPVAPYNRRVNHYTDFTPLPHRYWLPFTSQCKTNMKELFKTTKEDLVSGDVLLCFILTAMILQF